MNNSGFYQHLIAPLGTDVFFREYFEQKPLHIKRENEQYYDAILPAEEITDYLKREGNAYPNVQLVRDGVEIPTAHYTYEQTLKKRFHFQQVIDQEKVSRAFLHDKTSIIVFHAHRNILAVKSLCLHLERVFSCKVQANVYITPPSSSGFGIHYDTHDVLILQLTGTKYWQVFDDPFYLPYAGEMESYQDLTGRVSKANCIINEPLRQGDMLYLPRGYVHKVCAQEYPSVHITFGLLHDRNLDIVKELLTRYNADPIFRRSIPVRSFKEEGTEEYQKELASQISTRLGQFIQEMREKHLQNNDTPGITELEEFLQIRKRVRDSV